jgi:hypothetical protein
MDEITKPANQQSAPAPLTAEPPEPEYKGIRGWLLVFLCVLIVVNPLYIVSSIGSRPSDKNLESFNGYCILLGLSIIIYGIYTAIKLWRIKPKAVRSAKIYIWCMLVFFIITEVITPLLSGSFLISPGKIIAISQGIIVFSLWYGYLGGSKRVKATYKD